MTTLYGKFKQSLIGRGLEENQAIEVLEAVKNKPELKSLGIKWNDDSSGYPAVVLRALTPQVNQSALDWINANCPQAWFKSMFEPQA